LVHESNPIAGKKVIRPIQSNEDLVYVLNNILSFLSNKKDSSISNLDTVPFLRNIKVDLETPDEQSLLNIKSNAQIKIDPRIDITPKLKTTTQPPQQKSQSTSTTSTTTQPPAAPVEGAQTQPQPTTSNINEINEIDNKLAKLKED